MRPEEHLAAVVAAEAAGRQTPFLFFWGHQPQRDGTIGPGCLSQWWPARFTVDGVAYPTAEHWMMAGKARLFRDDQALAAVLAAADPQAAKAAGRSVRGFDERTWAAARFGLVVAGNLAAAVSQNTKGTPDSERVRGARAPATAGRKSD